MSHSLQPHGPWNSPGPIQEWVAFPFSRGSSQPRDPNPGLPNCRRILYQLSHQGSPRILEWVAYPFFRGSSRPGIQPGSPSLQADSLPTELSGKPNQHVEKYSKMCTVGFWTIYALGPQLMSNLELLKCSRCLIYGQSIGLIVKAVAIHLFRNCLQTCTQ